MKSFRGGKVVVVLHSILIQSLSRISSSSSREEATSAMTCCRTWAWIIAQTVSSWVVVAELKMTLKIWTSRPCSLRAQRIWMCPEAPVTYRHGKYNNNNHWPRLHLFPKCLLRFIKCFRAVCTFSQRWLTLRLSWWINMTSCHFLPCQKPLLRFKTMRPWVRELSSQMQAASAEDI